NRHMHHLVLCAVETCLLGPGRRRLANPLATALMAPFFITPAVVAVFVWNSAAASFAAVVAFSALYVLTYRGLVVVIQRYRRRAAAPSAAPAQQEPALV